jgi:undecaprenyl-diphosphatase
MSAWLVAAVLGVIEGLTEFIPVSSTGHLLLAEQWLPHQSEVFNVVIQCGAALALIPLFADRLRALIFGLDRVANRDFAFKLFVAFAITAAGGFALKKSGWSLPHKAAPVAWATLIGGVLILAIERIVRGKTMSDDVTWPIVIAVGAGQLIAAAFPGSSRSATTIMLALLLGLNRARATEFSFLLGIPTLLAAGIFETHHALKHPVPGEVVDWPMIFIGALTAAITAFYVVRW